MATKQAKGELVVVGFDYSPLEAKVAEKVRASAEAIRQQLQNTLVSAIKIGQELLAVKKDLEHGQFLLWLQAEFRWSQRAAYNFMSVAERFELATVANLPIQPSAAYLLAGPTVSDEVRQVVIEKARAGDEINTAVVKEVIAEAKKKRKPRRRKAVPTEKLGLRLANVLERYKTRWNPDDLSDLARQLREFADALEKPDRGGRKKAKE
jgi:hypothetical protein